MFKKTIIFILIFVNTSIIATASFFSDVSDEHPKSFAIEYVKDNGIFSGYSDGTFRPDDLINRAELTKVLVLAAPGVTDQVVDDYFMTNYLDNDYSYASFPDVDVKEWYAKYIAYAQGMGWIDGYPDGTFKPSQTVNFIEALKMIIEANGQKLNDTNEIFSIFKDTYIQFYGEEWWYDYLLTAYLKGVIGYEEYPMGLIYDFNNGTYGFVTNQPSLSEISTTYMNRGGIAEILYRFSSIEENQGLCFVPNLEHWNTYEETLTDFSFIYPSFFELSQVSTGKTFDHEKLRRIELFGVGNLFELSIIDTDNSITNIDNYIEYLKTEYEEMGAVLDDIFNISDIDVGDTRGIKLEAKDTESSIVLFMNNNYIYSFDSLFPDECGYFDMIYNSSEF